MCSRTCRENSESSFAIRSLMIAERSSKDFCFGGSGGGAVGRRIGRGGGAALPFGGRLPFPGNAPFAPVFVGTLGGGGSLDGSLAAGAWDFGGNFDDFAGALDGAFEGAFDPFPGAFEPIGAFEIRGAGFGAFLVPPFTGGGLFDFPA